MIFKPGEEVKFEIHTHGINIKEIVIIDRFDGNQLYYAHLKSGEKWTEKYENYLSKECITNEGYTYPINKVWLFSIMPKITKQYGVAIFCKGLTK